jgi:hypothetical protein
LCSIALFLQIVYVDPAIASRKEAEVERAARALRVKKRLLRGGRNAEDEGMSSDEEAEEVEMLLREELGGRYMGSFCCLNLLIFFAFPCVVVRADTDPGFFSFVLFALERQRGIGLRQRGHSTWGQNVGRQRRWWWVIVGFFRFRFGLRRGRGWGRSGRKSR